jgi:hypothetical protein
MPALELLGNMEKLKTSGSCIALDEDNMERSNVKN